jgi:WD40 repeat protein
MSSAEPRFSFAAFLSYSHAADDKLAPAIQSALHRLAKPWYRMRSVRVFRDKTSLSANPALWHAIVDALETSRYFLLMASPGAAASPWVQQEVNWWKENRPSDRTLILVTDGELRWDNQARDFDWSITTCLPPALHGYFREEPTWVDFRWAKSAEGLSLRHAQFRGAVLDLAAPLHGRAKDELDGDDVRQHQRVRWIVSAAGLALLILTIISVLAATRAIQQTRVAEQQRKNAEEQRNIAEQRRQEAERERTIALGRQLAADAALVRNEQPQQYELAALLLIEAARRSPPFESDDALREALTRVPLFVAGGEKTVNAVAFSPNGRMLAAVGWAGRLRTFDTGHWKPGWEAPANLRALSFSRDGRLLVGGKGDSEVVWEAATGRELRRVGRTGLINAFAAATDGTLSATAIREGGLVLTDLKTGQERQLLRNIPSESLAFSADDSRLAAVTGDQGVRLFDTVTGEQVRDLGHIDGIQTIAFSPDSKLLATAGREKTVRLYSVADGSMLHELTLDQGANSVAFNDDGTWLAVASGDKSARIYRLPGAGQIARFNHPDFVDRALFTPDSKYLITATSNEKTLRIWQPGETRETLRIVHRDFFSFAISPDGRYLATASQDGRVRVFQIEQTADPLVIVHPEKVIKVVFSSDGRLAASGAFDGVARVIERTSGREIRRSGHENTAKALAFSPDGRFAAIGSGDGGARVIEIANGREVNLPAHKYAVHQVAFSRDGRWAATGGQDGIARVSDAATGRTRADFQFGDSVEAVGLHPAGRWLLAATFGGVFLCDLETGARQPKPIPGVGHSFQFSADGTWAVFTSKSGVVLLHAQTWRELGRIDQPFAPEAVTISPDGKLIASQYGRTIEILDVGHRVSAGRLVMREEIVGMSFSPDSQRLYTATGTPRLMLQEHMLRTEDLASEMCRRLDRNLTPAEWKKYVGNATYQKTCEIRAVIG